MLDVLQDSWEFITLLFVESYTLWPSACGILNVVKFFSPEKKILVLNCFPKNNMSEPGFASMNRSPKVSSCCSVFLYESYCGLF